MKGRQEEGPPGHPGGTPQRPGDTGHSQGRRTYVLLDSRRRGDSSDVWPVRGAMAEMSRLAQRPTQTKPSAADAEPRATRTREERLARGLEEQAGPEARELWGGTTCHEGKGRRGVRSVGGSIASGEVAVVGAAVTVAPWGPRTMMCSAERPSRTPWTLVKTMCPYWLVNCHGPPTQKPGVNAGTRVSRHGSVPASAWIPCEPEPLLNTIH